MLTVFKKENYSFSHFAKLVFLTKTWEELLFRCIIPKMSFKKIVNMNLSFYSEFSFTRLGFQSLQVSTISTRLSLYKSSLWHICIAYEDCYWRFICSVQLNNLRTSNSLPESTICLWPVDTSSNPARWPTIHHEHETSPKKHFILTLPHLGLKKVHTGVRLPSGAAT